jgi:ABC-type glycerol-3-phosphate transport system permease component
MAAGSLLVVLPVLILAVFVQRGLIRGLTSGAVK